MGWGSIDAMGWGTQRCHGMGSTAVHSLLSWCPVGVPAVFPHRPACWGLSIALCHRCATGCLTAGTVMWPQGGCPQMRGTAGTGAPGHPGGSAAAPVASASSFRHGIAAREPRVCCTSATVKPRRQGPASSLPALVSGHGAWMGLHVGFRESQDWECPRSPVVPRAEFLADYGISVAGGAQWIWGFLLLGVPGRFGYSHCWRNQWIWGFLWPELLDAQRGFPPPGLFWGSGGSSQG